MANAPTGRTGLWSFMTAVNSQARSRPTSKDDILDPRCKWYRFSMIQARANPSLGGQSWNLNYHLSCAGHIAPACLQQTLAERRHIDLAEGLGLVEHQAFPSQRTDADLSLPTDAPRYLRGSPLHGFFAPSVYGSDFPVFAPSVNGSAFPLLAPSAYGLRGSPTLAALSAGFRLLFVDFLAPSV